MKLRTFLLFLVLSGMTVNVSGQSLRRHYNKQTSEAAERNRLAKERYNTAVEINSLEVYDEFLELYPKSKYTADIRQRRAKLEQELRDQADLEAYNEACESGMKSPLFAYLQEYPQGKYVKQAQARLNEIETFDKVKEVGTIEAYRSYLAANPQTSFQEEALAAIAELQSKEEWKALQSSQSISDLQQFLKNFPNTSCKDLAELRISLLQAREACNKGQYQEALNLFNACSTVTVDFRADYQKAREEVDFQAVKENQNMTLINSFISNYPNSSHINEVKNIWARKQAGDFNMYVTETNYQDVMEWATDDMTRAFVKSQYDFRKKEYTDYQHQQRRAERKRRGGWVQLGLQWLDFGFNYNESDGNKVLDWYYNVGLSVKFGNNYDRIQFEVGLLPGVMATTYTSEDYDDDSDYKFEMPAFARLKLNLTPKKKSTQWFVCSTIYNNLIRNKNLQEEWSVGAGIGIAGRHSEWQIFYFKQDLNSRWKEWDYFRFDRFYGTQVTYYF